MCYIKSCTLSNLGNIFALLKPKTSIPNSKAPCHQLQVQLPDSMIYLSWHQLLLCFIVLLKLCCELQLLLFLQKLPTRTLFLYHIIVDVPFNNLDGTFASPFLKKNKKKTKNKGHPWSSYYAKISEVLIHNGALIC